MILLELTLNEVPNLVQWLVSSGVTLGIWRGVKWIKEQSDKGKDRAKQIEDGVYKRLRDEVENLRARDEQLSGIVADLQDQVTAALVQRKEYETALKLLTDYIKDEE